MTKTNRIIWIDGIRGFACLMVMLHHFLVAYFPVLYYGESHPGLLNGEMLGWFASSCISFIFNGNFWVMVFCVISGYIVTYKIMNSDDLAISKFLFKRYLRLYFPILIVCIFVYITYQMGLYKHIEIGQLIDSPWLAQSGPNPTLKDLLLSPRILINNASGVFSNAFWMLSDLFLGTFLPVVLSMMVMNMTRYKKTILFIIAVILLPRTIFACFVFGTFLAVYAKEKTEVCSHRQWFYILLLGVACFLAGYPTGVVPDNIYRYLNFSTFSTLNVAYTWHALAAFLGIYSIYNIKSIKEIFSLKLFELLGKISYAVYLIHVPLIYLLSPYVFGVIFSYIGSYLASGAIMILICSMVIVILSYWFEKLVETRCNKIINQLLAIVFK